ncbi:MAG: hypothetical protein OIF32_12420 [Campylobacterales bacterium]|nr:hypothetical protein [Campylobacterales bacterium]
MKCINRKSLLWLTAVILLILGGYHLLIISEQISSENVWLGMIENREDLLKHEATSLILIGIALVTIILDYFHKVPNITRKIFLFFIVIFGLNTIVNLFAPTLLEQVGFSILAFIMMILMYCLSKKKEEK